MPFLLAHAVASAAPEMIPAEVWAEATRPAAVADDDVEIPLKDGGTFRLAEHRGRPVLLSFWASWCAPCRKELPALSSWSEAHPEVAVVAVNVDRARADAEAFVRRVRFDLPVAYDPDAAQLGRYGVTSMPTMFLFDRSGALAWRHTGYGEEKGFSALEAALAETR